MDQELSFSLIIPAYNEEKYIGACLEAGLANAKGTFKEIIVVNNASTDRTAEIAGSYPGVRVVDEPRKGLTRARQRGFLESTGDVLVYVDADTRPPAGWIQQVKAAFKDLSIIGVSGPYVYYDLPPYAGILVSTWNAATKILSYFTNSMLIGGNFAMRRDVIERIGGFDETIEFYGEDIDLAKRAHVHGKIQYSLGLTMPSSARRLKAQGFVRMGKLYAKNFFAVTLSGRPSTTEYEDFR